MAGSPLLFHAWLLVNGLEGVGMANLGGFASDNDDAEGVVLEVAPAPVKLIPPKMLDDPDPDDDVSEVEAPVGLQ